MFTTVVTTDVTTAEALVIVVVNVVIPVPIVLVIVRVGGFVVSSQLNTCSKHWHCKAGLVDRPI